MGLEKIEYSDTIRGHVEVLWKMIIHFPVTENVENFWD
jgi:hypothetical protein